MVATSPSQGLARRAVYARGDRGGLSVVLIDDVWTTGSTMKAAERTLKNSGIENVKYITLAKG